MKFLLFLIFHHLLFSSCRKNIKDFILLVFKTKLEESNVFIVIQYLVSIILTYLIIVLLYILFIDQGWGVEAFSPYVFFESIK